MFGPSWLSEASASAKMTMEGKMIRRGGKRSSKMPMPGETTATEIAARPNVPPDGFAPPAKCRMQRIQKEAECMRNDRSEADHYACEGGGHHSPPGISER